MATLTTATKTTFDEELHIPDYERCNPCKREHVAWNALVKMEYNGEHPTTHHLTMAKHVAC